MAAGKKKQCLGLVATSTDGILWRWTAGGNDYSWCPAGQLRWYGHTPSQEKIILWCKSVEIGMAYTLGKADCMESFDPIRVAPEVKQEGPPSPA